MILLCNLSFETDKASIPPTTSAIMPPKTAKSPTCQLTSSVNCMAMAGRAINEAAENQRAIRQGVRQKLRSFDSVVAISFV